MRPFIDAYGDIDRQTAERALTTTFIAVSTSIIYAAEIFGALTASFINDKWGRKMVFAVGSALIIAGAIAQVADDGIEGVIIIGRVLIGMGVGQLTVTTMLYMGEIAPTSIRGPILMMFQFMQSCSQLAGSGITQGTSSINNSGSYRIPMGLLMVFPIMMLLCLPFIPESPHWLIAKARADDARATLIQINQGITDYTPEHDITLLIEAVKTEKESLAQSSWISLAQSPVERRKFIYSCGSSCSQMVNGIIFFYSYGVIFAQSLGVKQPFTISVITNSLQVLAVGVSVVLGNKVPRRKNLLVTTLVMLCSFVILGGIGVKKITTNSAYAVVVFSYIVIIAYNFGWGTLGWVMAAETAVGPNRNKIMSCAIMTFYLTTWLTSFTAPYLYYDANLGVKLAFVYAGTTCISLSYVWFCVGETTGRTLHEVSMFFHDKVPARKWRSHLFEPHDISLESGSEVISTKC